jgi:hypothetical protein
LRDLLQRSEIQMTKNIPNTCLIHSLLEQRRGLSESEQNAKFIVDKSIAYQAMTLMEAGADITAITAMNFLRAMPYINQIVKEVMCGRPVIVMSVPHANAVADSLNGYHIPPHSALFSNMWAMQRDAPGSSCRSASSGARIRRRLSRALRRTRWTATTTSSGGAAHLSGDAPRGSECAVARCADLVGF